MSSTKSKAAFPIGAFLVLAIAIIGGWKGTRDRKTPPDLRGFWEGAIEVQNAKLRLVVKVDQAPDGTYTATMDSVDQGAKDIPTRAAQHWTINMFVKPARQLVLHMLVPSLDYFMYHLCPDLWIVRYYAATELSNRIIAFTDS